MSDQFRDDPRIGTHIGDWTIDGPLGEGGMAKVYRARGPDGSRVALKVVKEDYARDETFRRRFHREARIAQTVKHPHVVPMIAAGEHEGIPYLVQRFIEGLTLDQLIKAHGRLDIVSVVRICGDVAGGLEALWAVGIVHRDVKPANILLDGQHRAYITDFGLAKDVQGSLLTLPGQALGSLDYMAPEQIRGESVSAASDVYALGCAMYECVCGRPPFADAQGMRILWAHLQDAPPDPVSVRRDISPGFGQALLRALEKEAGKRPQSAGEYARELAKAALREGSTGAGRAQRQRTE